MGAEIRVLGPAEIEDYHAHLVRLDRTSRLPGTDDRAIQMHCLELLSNNAILIGAFVDGVYLFAGVQSLTMDDIERVEVIKGPQSAMFGRSTFGGAVNFVTPTAFDFRKPTVRVFASYGINDRAQKDDEPAGSGQIQSRPFCHWDAGNAP